jgi:hypothetical protein
MWSGHALGWSSSGSPRLKSAISLEGSSALPAVRVSRTTTQHARNDVDMDLEHTALAAGVLVPFVVGGGEVVSFDPDVEVVSSDVEWGMVSGDWWSARPVSASVKSRG